MSLTLESLDPKYAQAIINEWAHEKSRDIIANPCTLDERRQLAFYIADLTRENSHQIRKENNWEDPFWKSIVWVDKNRPETYKPDDYKFSIAHKRLNKESFADKIVGKPYIVEDHRDTQ